MKKFGGPAVICNGGNRTMYHGGLLNEGASPKVSSNRRHFNRPIHTSLCHVKTVYGLVQPIAGRNRVNNQDELVLVIYEYVSRLCPLA